MSQTSSTYMSLFEAVRSKDLNFLKDFIGKGSDDINDRNEDGVTCLHIAAGLDDKTILDYLLRHGADVDSQTLDGLTPLHVAATWGRTDNVQVLLNYGANLYIKDKEGYDAQLYALRSEQEGSKLIVDYLASMSLQNATNTARTSQANSLDKDSETFVTACCSQELDDTPNIEIDFEKLNGSPWITPRRKQREDKTRNCEACKSNCFKDIYTKLSCADNSEAAHAYLSNDAKESSNAGEKDTVKGNNKEGSFTSNYSHDQNLFSSSRENVSDSKAFNGDEGLLISREIKKLSSNFEHYQEYLTEMSLDSCMLSNSGYSDSSVSPTFSYSTITCLEPQKYPSQNDSSINLNPLCSFSLLTECSSFGDKGDSKELEKQENKQRKETCQAEREEEIYEDEGGVEIEVDGEGDERDEDREVEEEVEEVGEGGGYGIQEGGNEGDEVEEEIKGGEKGEGQQDIKKDRNKEICEEEIFELKNSSEKIVRSRDDPSNFQSNKTFTVNKPRNTPVKKYSNFFIPLQSSTSPLSRPLSVTATPMINTHFSNCLPVLSNAEETVVYDWKDCSTNSDTKDEPAIHIPESFCCLPIEEIKKRIISCGQTPGPITPYTKHLYLRKLWKLEQGLSAKNSKNHSPFSKYPPEVRMVLTGRSAIPECSSLEEDMMREFSQPSKKTQWRGRNEKSSFNYLLLDPRVTCNLPGRYQNLSKTEAFRCFVLSVFYVGKGKRSRPYAHLHEAVKCSKSGKTNKKLAQIWDIWDAGLGVISLHIFQSAIPVEAFTREACMIDALGLSQLTNQKRGEYYGVCASLPTRKKRNLGIFLFHKALQIFLNEGERQICEEDL